MGPKILLTAVNAKYIHSNPAVYSLRACAGKIPEADLEIAEYTINHKEEAILADIYGRRPGVVAFSCYIWNWNRIGVLLEELPKVLPQTQIWLGGPEVSYHPEEILNRYPMITGIMTGEGEATFYELVQYYCGEREPEGNIGKRELSGIAGILYRDGEKVIRTASREPVKLSEIPFLYDNLEPFTNKIIYYESSRGCPYRCSYCLSSIDKRVRLRDIGMVKRELQFFLDNKVRQVKFVDRTFNCNHEHAKEIWRYLLENDNNVTNFHFEIAADLLTEEELEILEKMRPGLAQFEIGVQTFNPDTLREIRRATDMDRLRCMVERLGRSRNIHIHLDLIAGLPYEGYGSFIRSFCAVYAMQPQQLQLGFLKVLRGSYLYEKAVDYEICYTGRPPYEVLSTRWLSYEELLSLKQVEEMVEIYYNSGQFRHTIRLLESVFPDAFAMYKGLANFYREQGCERMTPSREYRYQALFSFALTTPLAGREELLRQVLTLDFYLRENSKSRPSFARDLTPYKEAVRDIYKKEEKSRRYLPDYAAYDYRQLRKMTHLEVFDYPVWEEDAAAWEKRLDTPRMLVFDYRKRDAVTCEARHFVIDR